MSAEATRNIRKLSRKQAYKKFPTSSGNQVTKSDRKLRRERFLGSNNLLEQRARFATSK